MTQMSSNEGDNEGNDALYASLRQYFERELAPLPDMDLEAFAAEEGALPLEAFIDELDPETEAQA
jgi:hypothetical protein